VIVRDEQPRLYPSERKLYELFLQTGWSNKLLAHHLGLTYGTVKDYWSHIFKVHGVGSRSELLMQRIHELEAELKTATREKAA
jgi:DNA-binding NarL/FixJ family response regulator